MTRPWGLFLLLLTIPVALVTSTDLAKKRVKILRPFKSIEFSDANMRQCLWFAMQEYNKESEDEYIFLVSQIQLAQMQITDHMEYIIEVEIARSNCRKPLNNNENCIIETNSNLEKRVNCSFLVIALPWNGKFSVLKKECRKIQV